MQRPNFFVVGAPKCGTTALHSYLSQHPDVFLAKKEIHYFGADLDFRYRQRRSERDYLGLFAAAGSESHLGDGSVWYLYSTRAAREIASFQPEARIVIMLRNPVDMMYSLHSQFVYAGDEDLPSFPDALAAEEERRRGHGIPRGARLPRALLYRDVARYAAQVERYFDVFGTSRVHIILFDELKQDPEIAYASTLRFLGAAPDHSVDFAIVNPNTVRRSGWLARHMAVPRPGVRRFVRLLLPVGRWRRATARKVSQINTVRRSRTPLEGDLRKALTEELAVDIRKLEALISRDLNAWLEPRP